MNIEKQLETAVKTNHLVLVVFYADWSPHYEWIGPVLRTYEKRTVELIRVNAEENRTIADAPDTFRYPRQHPIPIYRPLGRPFLIPVFITWQVPIQGISDLQMQVYLLEMLVI